MAQQQGLLTITGYVGGQPTQFNREGMPHASSFRLASTRHYFDGRTQQWKDLPTTWITVKAYRGLSESICQSFKNLSVIFLDPCPFQQITMVVINCCDPVQKHLFGRSKGQTIHILKGQE